MGTTLALVGGLFGLVGLAIWVAIRAAREAAKAGLEAQNASDALADRERLDEVMASRIGRRRKLLAWLKAREAAKDRKP